jgi:hypothetical protein
MTEKNTINICLGHLPFPRSHAHHIDLMVSPRMIAEVRRLALVEDSSFGPNGSSLSEYAQLIWINDNLGSLVGERKYVRIFHYRRFVSAKEPATGRPSANLPWATVITEKELTEYDSAFDRVVTGDVFNTPAQFKGGMIAQYAMSHVMEDMMRFCVFLIEQKILSPIEVAMFLREDIHIPSCNIGIFKAESFRSIFSELKRAAEFITSPYFTPRDGYQRRSAGFLLERLNSFLIISRIRAGVIPESFGHNIVVSDSEVVSATN